MKKSGEWSFKKTSDDICKYDSAGQKVSFIWEEKINKSFVLDFVAPEGLKTPKMWL